MRIWSTTPISRQFIAGYAPFARGSYPEDAKKSRLSSARSVPDFGDQLGADQHADTVAQQGGEVAPVFGGHEPRA